MKTFDLEKALNTGKALTRDGREVTQLVKFDIDDSYSLHGVVDDCVSSWTDSGDTWDNETKSDLDLQNIPEKLSGFINVYPNKDCCFYKTLGEAKIASPINLVARIDLSQFNVGHGLEDE